MIAVIVEAFGGPERLEVGETADVEPGAGQVLIAVEACDVLFLDTMLRSGAAPPDMRPALPWTPGNGVAGRVVAVGDGVDGDWVGRLVGAHTGNRGGYAELVTVPVGNAVPVPDGVDAGVAAALLHDGPTALGLAEVTAVSADDTVLVLGASGGLGLTLVQLARGRGARVVAVARDAAKRSRIAAFGPDAVVDPEDPDWPALAEDALGPDGATVVFDNVGGSLGRQASALLAHGGRFSAHATHGGPFTELDPDVVRQSDATVTGIEAVQFSASRFAELTAHAFAAAATGDLRPVVGQTFPLGEAARAHHAVESRRVFGKTLLMAR